MTGAWGKKGVPLVHTSLGTPFPQPTKGQKLARPDLMQLIRSLGCRDAAGERSGHIVVFSRCWTLVRLVYHMPAEMNQTLLPIRLHILLISVRSMEIEM